MSQLTDVETELRRMADALKSAGAHKGNIVLVLAADIVRQSGANQSAVHYCLGTLKSHHMTKPGISTLVRKTEDILSNAQGELRREETL